VKKLTAAEYEPEVHYVNYVPVETDWVWGPRTIEDFELILVVMAEFEYSETGRDPIKLEEGDVLCIPPGTEHVFRSRRIFPDHPPVMSCIHLEMTKGSFLYGEYQLAVPLPLVTRTGRNSVIHELFKRCDAVYNRVSPNRETLLQAIAWEILLHLEEFHKGGTARLSLRMQKMLRYIQQHVHEPVTRLDLAREFSISPEHVNALFKKELSSTPTQEIHRAKIFRAYTCLTCDGLSVKETAEKMGFCDEFYFSKVFRRHIGQPPSRVRPRPAS
jgi:AraC family transcriptional activator of pobA